MANKPYFTLGRANEVLSLYGVKIKKVYEYWDGVNKNARVTYTYVAIKITEPMPEWSWEVTKIYIPYSIRTNMERVEYVIKNLNGLK
jgi:hypothetical protein